MSSKTLGDYAKIQGGFAYKSSDFSSIGVPVIKIKNVGKGSLLYDDVSYVDESFLQTTSNYITRDNDVLISMTGSNINQPASMVGRVAKVSKNDPISLINQRVGRVVLKKENEIDLKFIYYFLSQTETQYYLVSSASGSANQVNINAKLIESLEIPNFDYETTKKIAHILGALDDKIELNRKMNQTLEEMASAIFKSWFVDFDPVHAKANCTDEAEFENIAKELGISKEILDLFPSEFEESELGMIPKGWEVKTLDDIVDFQNGYSFKSNELHENQINSIKVFKMGHINRGGGFKEEGKDTYFTVDDKNKMERYFLKKGDLLMAMTDMKANMALLAHTALMPYDDLYLLNQRVGRLRVKENCKIGYSQLYIFTNYQDTVQDLRSRSNSGVQVNLTTKAILETKILIASDELLEKFNLLVEPLFEKMFKNDDEIISLQKTRDILLPKLLSGEIDVSELEIL